MLFRYSDVGRDRYILNFIRAWVVAEDEIGPVVGEDSSVTMLHLTTSSTPLSHPVVQWCALTGNCYSSWVLASLDTSLFWAVCLGQVLSTASS